jgi:hypothetical protein
LGNTLLDSGESGRIRSSLMSASGSKAKLYGDKRMSTLARISLVYVHPWSNHHFGDRWRDPISSGQTSKMVYF